MSEDAARFEAFGLVPHSIGSVCLNFEVQLRELLLLWSLVVHKVTDLREFVVLGCIQPLPDSLLVGLIRLFFPLLQGCWHLKRLSSFEVPIYNIELAWNEVVVIVRLISAQWQVPFAALHDDFIVVLYGLIIHDLAGVLLNLLGHRLQDVALQVVCNQRVVYHTYQISIQII